MPCPESKPAFPGSRSHHCHREPSRLSRSALPHLFLLQPVIQLSGFGERAATTFGKFAPYRAPRPNARQWTTCGGRKQSSQVGSANFRVLAIATRSVANIYRHRACPAGKAFENEDSSLQKSSSVPPPAAGRSTVENGQARVVIHVPTGASPVVLIRYTLPYPPRDRSEVELSGPRTH